jgi:putative two-component system response regulator
MAKQIALSHHEKWDGTGYPFQLIGDMIPLPARIVSVADVYDALRMERSYKPALDHAATVKQMVSEKETHFDPFLVEVFLSIADKQYSANIFCSSVRKNKAFFFPASAT